MSGNPVHWFEIYVQDMDRAKRFYETVFQFKLRKLEDSPLDIWAFPMSKGTDGAGLPGASGALVKMDDFPSGGNGTLIYFYCADCAVESAQIVPAGGRLCREKFSIGSYGFIAHGYDTEGNMFGMHTP